MNSLQPDREPLTKSSRRRMLLTTSIKYCHFDERSRNFTVQFKWDDRDWFWWSQVIVIRVFRCMLVFDFWTCFLIHIASLSRAFCGWHPWLASCIKGFRLVWPLEQEFFGIIQIYRILGFQMLWILVFSLQKWHPDKGENFVVFVCNRSPAKTVKENGLAYPEVSRCDQPFIRFTVRHTDAKRIFPSSWITHLLKVHEPTVSPLRIRFTERVVAMQEGMTSVSLGIC